MAFNSYTAIITSVNSWLARSDLTSVIPDFISLGERRISRDIRIKEFQVSTSVTASTAGVLGVGSNLIEIKSVINTSSSPPSYIEMKDYEWLQRVYPDDTYTGFTKYGALFGTSLYVRPVPSSTSIFKIEYYYKPVPLSSSNNTNLYTSNVADALFYATLTESALYLRDDTRLPFWESKYKQIVDGYNKTDKKNSRHGSIVSVR